VGQIRGDGVGVLEGGGRVVEDLGGHDDGGSLLELHLGLDVVEEWCRRRHRLVERAGARDGEGMGAVVVHGDERAGLLLVLLLLLLVLLVLRHGDRLGIDELLLQLLSVVRVEEGLGRVGPDERICSAASRLGLRLVLLVLLVTPFLGERLMEAMVVELTQERGLWLVVPERDMLWGKRMNGVVGHDAAGGGLEDGKVKGEVGGGVGDRAKAV
jgi:hypothetical protein